MKIRVFHKNDYDAVCLLWRKCNIELGTSDSREEINKFIDMNPQTCLVGEIDGKIISCVLGGYDGRRGLVHHLAVDPTYQKKGYGKELLIVLENRFKEMGVVKISFWVKTDNLEVIDFYNKQEYKLRDDLITMSKVL